MAAIRSLMDAVFDRVSDDTFDNTLGGVHALILELTCDWRPASLW